MNATFTTRALSIALFAAALLGNTGCARMMRKPAKMLSLDSTWPFRDENEPQEGTPTRMACTWTDTVMSTPGKKSQRGFGGRIMFYEKEEKKPILVDGQLVVYAFDENNREPTDNKPTRRYVFPVDQIPLHMSKNEFGASYSFFLPWDEAGGPTTEVGLICRFEPKDGPVVTSEQTKQKLPGSMPALTADGKTQPPKLPEGVPSKPVVPTLQSLQAKRTDEHRAQQASYEAPATGDGQVVTAGSVAEAGLLANRRMSSTTINLPNSFQMPNAAMLMNQSAPASNAIQPTQPAVQTQQPQQQHNQPPAQQSSAAISNPPSGIQTTVQQQGGLSRSFPGVKAMAPVGALAPPVVFGQAPAPVNTNLQTSPMAPNAQPLAAQSSPALMQTPPGSNSIPVPEGPMAQLQVQQNIQQAVLQQQLLQQQMLQQQRMLQQQMPTQQTAAQSPSIAGGTATVSYPSGGQYRR